MAVELVNAYADVPALKAYMGNKANTFSNADEPVVALNGASRDLDAWTRRRFWKSTDPVTRVYYGDSVTGLAIDDAWEVVSLTVNGDLLDLDEFDLWPLNGVREGIEGWPVTEIRSRPLAGAASFAGRCEVVLKPGWAQVPDPVYQATLILASEGVRVGDVPFGIAGFNTDGDAVRVGRLNPLVVGKLLPYQRAEEVVVG